MRGAWILHLFVCAMVCIVAVALLHVYGQASGILQIIKGTCDCTVLAYEPYVRVGHFHFICLLLV